MASRSLSDLHPQLLPLCQQFLDQCAHAGYKVGISCTYRSFDEQNADYAKGRTAPGNIITNAQGGQSAHNCTMEDGTPAAKAFDIFVYAPNGSTLDWNASDPAWKAILKIGEDLGLVSGSTWRMHDNPHFELPDWRNVPTSQTI